MIVGGVLLAIESLSGASRIETLGVTALDGEFIIRSCARRKERRDSSFQFREEKASKTISKMDEMTRDRLCSS